MSVKKFVLTGILSAALSAVSVPAKPIRVAFLKVVYTGAYAHSAIKKGTPYFEEMLRNPNGLTDTTSLVNSVLGTGEPIRVPPDGFRIDTIGNGNFSTPANLAKFMRLLDSIDVLVLSNTIGFGGIVTSDSDRAKFLDFADRKGIISLHMANDNHGISSTAPTWAAFDSLCGVMFRDHATANAVMLADSLPYNTSDTEFTFLKKGLRPKYTFNEELCSFTRNPRPLPGVHVLYTIDENVYTPSTRMGDHPFIWYQNATSGHGGRYFFTGVGHTDSLYQKNYAFRRQFYNAVLWAAKADSNGIVAARPGGRAGTSTAPLFHTVAEGGNLTVTPLKIAPYTVEIRELDGGRIAVAEARDGRPTLFSLRPHALYSITVESGRERHSGLVAMP